MLARIGGDEFGILLAIDEGPGEAEQVARRIRAGAGHAVPVERFEIRVSASIGLSFGDESVDEPEP